jgi:(4S)-4-hydroxy-5-phosphonooxypentane-2,3-dione isomerase
MLVVHVHVHVRPGDIEGFLEATRQNARASLTEPGVLRFDVIRDEADPGHVVLVEVYLDGAAAAAHKETEHYARWRDAVAELMVRPRESVKFSAVFPPAEAGWATRP